MSTSNKSSLSDTVELETNATELQSELQSNDIIQNPNKPHSRQRKHNRVYKRRGQSSLRTEHCARLSRLLHVMVRQRNWKEASGVLSVLLKGSIREIFIMENHEKYLATMELLKKMENDHIRSTNIKHVYDIWIEKNGAMKKCPAKDRFSTALEFVLFCFTHWDIDGANDAMPSLMQRKEYQNDPLLNMLVGLIFYELWYMRIPREMKLKSSDILSISGLSSLSGLDSFNPVESSCYSVDYQNTRSPAPCDSASSIGNNKNQHIDSVNDVQRKPAIQAFQLQGFYMEESNDISGNKEANHSENLRDTSIFRFHGLNPTLLPLRLPELNENSGNSINNYMGTMNDNYSKAVKYLRLALYSTPPVMASLLPLVQLLLLGDRVAEALKEIDNLCQASNGVLPFRMRAGLLECFDSKNLILISACYEDIMKIDPTCSNSLTRLITMHKNGDYGLVPLLEMIVLHLDATYASCSVWGELASCFLKLSHCEEDQLSVCGDATGSLFKRFSTSLESIPLGFIHGKSRKLWEVRCRWWTRRHFSMDTEISEIKGGYWELLTSKAACASHLYGPKSRYAASVWAYLEKNKKKDQKLFLQAHMKSSVKVWEQLKSKEIMLDEQSCFSN